MLTPSHVRNIGALLLIALAFSFSSNSLALGLPENGKVMVGEVDMVPSDASAPASGSLTMVLKQHSNHAAMDWDAFSIQDNATLDIQQPSNASILINRVSGRLPSVISGEIRSNGIVMLVNPNGVVITQAADIHGPAFIVSNRDMADAELAGTYWSTLPRLLEVARASSVNTDVSSMSSKASSNVLQQIQRPKNDLDCSPDNEVQVTARLGAGPASLAAGASLGYTMKEFSPPFAYPKPMAPPHVDPIAHAQFSVTSTLPSWVRPPAIATRLGHLGNGQAHLNGQLIATWLLNGLRRFH